MSDEPGCETYTPCFDWVIQATGSQPAALTYGVVWRYAQMSGARCYASCERLAEHLAWTRQSVMRHLRSLCRLGLVTCANPDQPGVPREYLPVSREHWLAARGLEAQAALAHPRRRRHPARRRLDSIALVPAPQDPASQAAAPQEHATPDSALPIAALDTAQPETLPLVSGPVKSDPPGADPLDTPRAEAVESPSVATEAVACSDGAADAANASGASGTAPVTDSDPLEVNANGPVPSADTPCHKIAHPPVTSTDTKKTTRNTSKRRGGTAVRRDPGIVLLRKLTGRLPPAVLGTQVLGTLGASPDPERLASCYRAWCARGYNPMNYAWLFDWYARGEIPPPRAGGPQPLPNEAEADPASPASASAATASAASFARWQAYQQAIQKGESPDEVRRRLNL
jgi:hypothetical protein